jgi:hypothetical protein
MIPSCLTVFEDVLQNYANSCLQKENKIASSGEDALLRTFFSNLKNIANCSDAEILLRCVNGFSVYAVLSYLSKGFTFALLFEKRGKESGQAGFRISVFLNCKKSANCSCTPE